jgi:ADP-heptose:LPS heptosyltransferase
VKDRDQVLRAFERIPRLLVIRLRSLGDSILSLHLLEALAEYRSDLGIDVLTETPFAPVFAGHRAISEVVTVRPRGSAAATSRARTLADIARRRYPAVLNLHGGSTSLVLMLASGARLRIGHEGYRNAWAYNVRIPRSSRVWGRTDLHTVEHQLSLLRWLGIAVPAERRPRLAVDAGARRRVAAKLERSGIRQERYLVVHPTATLFTKQWQEHKFAGLADVLTRDFGLPVVFSAARHEEPTLQKIAARAAGSHLYWSDLDLAELFALIDGSSLFIGNDSGPTHAAAALGRPVVVVWGSSNCTAWRPWGSDYELIRSDLPCMPCPGYRCAAFGEPKCILDLQVERVAAACRRIIARHPLYV